MYRSPYSSSYSAIRKKRRIALRVNGAWLSDRCLGFRSIMSVEAGAQSDSNSHLLDCQTGRDTTLTLLAVTELHVNASIHAHRRLGSLISSLRTRTENAVQRFLSRANRRDSSRTERRPQDPPQVRDGSPAGQQLLPWLLGIAVSPGVCMGILATGAA